MAWWGLVLRHPAPISALAQTHQAVAEAARQSWLPQVGLAHLGAWATLLWELPGLFVLGCGTGTASKRGGPGTGTAGPQSELSSPCMDLCVTDH